MMDDEPGGIQLRGKQLVFQAMSAIVVAVGIFLLGVMVGRGVPTARQSAAVLTQEEDVAPLVPSSAIPPDEILPVGQDDGGPNPTYQDELVSDNPAEDSAIKPAPPRPEPFAADSALIAPPVSEARIAVDAAPAPPVQKAVEKKAEAAVGTLAEQAVARPAEKPAAARNTAATAKPAKDARKASAPTPSASGFMVQVAAYQRRGEANGVRDRLTSKGYPAFVTSASTATGTFYRVRVGGYEKEADAKSVAARLRREEHLEPWVTR